MRNFIIIIIFILSEAKFSTAQNYVWTQKANFGGGDRYCAMGASVGNKGYAGLGVTITSGGSALNYNHVDWWEYDPSTDVWTQKANFIGAGRNGASVFVLHEYIYVGTGWTPSATTTFYRYNTTNNVWDIAPNFAGYARYDCVSFAINNKGYVGLGYAPYANDLWEFDPQSAAWTQKATFPGGARQVASAFVINGAAFVGSGDVQFGNYYNDLWGFDPVANSWTQKANLPGPGRGAGEGFAIGENGFMGIGTNEIVVFKDFYRYDPLNDSWIAITDFPDIRWHAFSFVINNCAYVGAGAISLFPNAVAKSDFWCMCDPTGIGDQYDSSFSLSIYPNPVSDFLKLEFTKVAPTGNLKIVIQGQDGKVIYTQILKSSKLITISVNSIAPGNYILALYSNQNKIIARKKFEIL